MTSSDNLKHYYDVFKDDLDKAKAFDKIAERYFAVNFGTMQKSDFETLLFSLYLDQLLAASSKDMSTFSDYRLARELGIPQSKVRNLKVKKQLQFPYDYNWQKSFLSICENARYENGKIKIHIPDINLFYEIKNAIEENGGYIDMSLNSKLLQVSPEYFIDIMLSISEDKDRKAIKANLRKEMQEKGIDTTYFDSKPMGEILKHSGIEMIGELLAACVPFVGPALKVLINNVAKNTV